MTALRLGHLGGNLGHELARADPHRAAQSLGALEDSGTEIGGDLVQRVEILDVDPSRLQIDEGLVKAQRLDEGRQFSQGCHDDLGGLPVCLESSREKGGMGSQTSSL